MGGSAFSATLSVSAFPRMCPLVYQSLKARLIPVISSFYGLVTVPHEAPGKADHGDLDLLVAQPLAPYSEAGRVPHAIIAAALKADHVVPMEGNRTSNYAVPIQPGEWAQFGASQMEDEARQAVEDGKIFVQVDIHVCEDEHEFKRIDFFHSYGDLGMILGVAARNVGLAWGVNGIKLVDTPHKAFPLSSDMCQILKFFFPSTWDQHEQGFKTRREIYDWVLTSPLFSLNYFYAQGVGFTKVKPERKMYHEFVAFIHEKQAALAQDLSAHPPLETKDERTLRIRNEALDYFGKREEYEASVRARGTRVKLKSTFSGITVSEMSGLGTYWLGVKRIMDAVRGKLGGDEGALAYAQTHGEEAFRESIIAVRDELGIRPRS